MKDGYIRVASASFEVKLGNVKENAKQIIEQINIAKEKDIQMPKLNAIIGTET